MTSESVVGMVWAVTSARRPTAHQLLEEQGDAVGPAHQRLAYVRAQPDRARQLLEHRVASGALNRSSCNVASVGPVIHLRSPAGHS